MTFKIVKTVDITDLYGNTRTLELCVGDVLDSGSGKPDLLVISSFPDDYYPATGTVVAGLDKAGVSVWELAEDKYLDWRRTWQTWVSKPLKRNAPCRRLACFEHGYGTEPDAVVGNVFRALCELSLKTDGHSLGVVRLPLLSTGNQEADKDTMLNAILEQAYTHLCAGLPVQRIQLVIHIRSRDLHGLLVEAGRRLASVELDWLGSQRGEVSHDLFVSYRRTDQCFVDALVDSLRLVRRGLQIFIDHESLQHGSPWKPDLIRALHGARHALCIVTDSYAESTECIDEFHIARLCGIRRSGYLLPLFNLSACPVHRLPHSIRSVNAMQANSPPRRIDEVARDIVDRMRHACFSRNDF